MTAPIKPCPVENDLYPFGGLTDSCATCPNRISAPCVWTPVYRDEGYKTACGYTPDFLSIADKFCNFCGHPIEAKVDEVKYWRHDNAATDCVKTVNGIIVEHTGGYIDSAIGCKLTCVLCLANPITKEEYEAAKTPAKVDEPVVKYWRGDGYFNGMVVTTNRDLVVNVNQNTYRGWIGQTWNERDCSWREISKAEYEAAKTPAPTTFTIEGKPATAGECAAFIQGVQSEKEAAKPAVEPLQRPVSHNTPEHMRKVLDSILEWSIRIEERVEALELKTKP